MSNLFSRYFIQKPYSLKAQTSLLFVGKFISLLFQMLTPIILTRLLSRENYGLYQQILLLCTFIAPILIWGITSSLYYFFPIAGNKTNQLVTQTLFSLLLIGALFIPVLFVCKGVFAAILSNQSFYQYIIPCSLYILFYMQSDVIENLFVVEKRSNYVIAYLIVSSLFRLCFTVFAFLIFRTVAAQIWGLVIHLGLQTIFLWGYILKHYQIQLDFRQWDLSYFSTQLKYSNPLGMSSLVGTIGTKIDKFILSYYFTQADFAVYSVAFFRIPFVNILFPSVGNVIIPQIVKYGKEGNRQEAKRLWHKMIVVFSLITIPIVLYSFFTSQELIILLFSDKYISSIGIYRLTLLTFFVQILARGTIITAFGETKYLFKVQFVSTIIGSLLGFILVKRIGLWGAAFTYVFIFYLSGLLQVYKSKKILKLKFAEWLPWSDLWKILLISLIGIPIIILLKNIIHNKILYLITTFAGYFAVIFRLYIFYDYSEIIDVIKGIWKRK